MIKTTPFEMVFIIRDIMKSFQKLIATFIILGLICIPMKASATIHNSVANDTIQQEIDALMTELNELAAEERMLCSMDSKALSATTTSNTTQLNAVSHRKTALEEQLEKLGVHTIDPNNSTDMAQLEEVVLGSANANSTANIPDPPNLNALASCYTLSQYNNSTYVDGVEYNYSFIYVTDNKGYSGSPLTVLETTNTLIGRESKPLADMLDYQFSFALSEYLGSIPYGWLIEWSLGTAFTLLNSLDETSIVTYSGYKSIYNMSMMSVTQMLYCYVYLPNAGWVLCGVKAPNVSYTRIEYFMANIDGTPYSYTKNYPTVTSSTGIATITYAVNYIKGSGCDIDRIGSFRVNTYGGNHVRFTPGFADYPMHLA